jgi:hypothetical protein
VKERGILFTPENIRAVLRKDNPKTQTRRVATFPSWVTEVERTGKWFTGNGTHPSGECEHSKCAHIGGLCGDGGMSMFTLTCPQGEVGDRLYVKEGVIVHASIPQLCGYYMDGARATEHWEKRLTALYMPKYAARTWLEITDVRVERLQDISGRDAFQEGITVLCYDEDISRETLNELALSGYHRLWDSINEQKHPWSSNPWVWCLTFTRI